MLIKLPYGANKKTLFQKIDDDIADIGPCVSGPDKGVTEPI